MIEDAPLLTLRRGFSRPPADLVEALVGVPTGFVVDALGGAGALDWRIKPIAGIGSSVTGVVVTCDAGPADNLAVFGALEIARPGDVILCAAHGFTGVAVVGDQLMGMMRNRGVLGFITDGLVRDIPGLIHVGVPCFGIGVSPNSPAKNGPGTAGLPTVVGGVAVQSGDVVVTDVDGVVVVPQALLAATVAKLAEVRAAEAALEARVKGGLQVPQFVADLIASGRVREVE